MKVWLRVHGYEQCSWTSVWENLCAAFKEAGHELYSVTGPEDTSDTVELWWGDPQFWHWHPGVVKARVALCLSEAHSILRQGREQAIANLQEAELIICPAEAATIAFKEAPIDAPIRVVNFGVDDTHLEYVERDWSGTLNFLHAGATQFRKGSWMVPEAFVAAFGSSDDAKLTILSPKVMPMYTRLKGEYGRHPNIEFIEDFLDSPLQLYQEHHIYVSPHLSEGFGLMPLEAMATGMAGIIARCSAPREYFRKEFGWWIEMSENYAPVEDCLPDTAGFWRLPDMPSLTRAMQLAHRGKELARRKGLAASEFILKNMTWKHTVAGIVRTIEEVLDAKDFGSAERIQRGVSAPARLGEYSGLC